jgi:hypothetical protein
LEITVEDVGEILTHADPSNGVPSVLYTASVVGLVTEINFVVKVVIPVQPV